MIDLEKVLAPLCGRTVEVKIEDLSGQDPVAPSRMVELLSVKLESEDGGGSFLKCYIGGGQHVTIPVLSDGCTQFIIDGPSGARLLSEDRGAQLVYSLVWKA